MLRHQADIRPDPTIVLIDDLLNDMARGQVRIPAFQRPFVWRPPQMLELFDSIERGYPVGSLLLWQPDEPVESLEEIAGLEIPPPPPNRTISYVLDGHQRLSTLFGVLHRLSGERSRFDADEDQEWRWRIYRDLREDPFDTDRYRHLRPEVRSAPPYLLPLAAVMRTMDFLGHFRELELMDLPRRQIDALTREAEAVAQRIKSYKMTVVKLPGASIDQAVNVYARLNRSGTRMDPDQMVSALTYRPEQRSLANRIDDIVSSVAEDGFGELPRLAVFRSVLAVADEPDVMSPRWEAVARQMQNRLHDAVPAAARAIEAAVGFLRSAVPLPLARLLPYSHQLVLLAKFFHHCPQVSLKHLHELRRWFWLTSWTSAFGGATSTLLRLALRNMRDYALGVADLELPEAEAQPMPESFNLNSARTKAYVIWELREFRNRLDALGQPFDVVKEFAAGGAQSYRQVVPGDRRPANRLILPTTPGVRLLDALDNLELSAGQSRTELDDVWQDLLTARYPDAHVLSRAEQVLHSHGIPVIAWHRLRDGKRTLFLDDRSRFLKERLWTFAEQVGVPLGSAVQEGASDDDSE
ncbi:hypothetical protein CA850_06325 [Micromonospora echinospora]|uniref:GmrSD restriction endonucleases N-terminal domain-containing protein n=1 Tax=Micromonospora echinospora TaxID=1877 RepID=A0A1C4V5S0_MICEC|nr:DUF262 domain-containing protein [Micromonospora echinospora]OZV83109.1 hypothetical protein CA850_06325 [Micromonospora echinospora]SCE79360.1 Protein of unknown function DUF262 [Micromonospora echinospora]